jgi:hypothetical protein
MKTRSNAETKNREKRGVLGDEMSWGINWLLRCRERAFVAASPAAFLVG